MALYTVFGTNGHSVNLNFFFFFLKNFFFNFMATPVAYGKSPRGLNWSYSYWPKPQPQQRRI